MDRTASGSPRRIRDYGSISSNVTARRYRNLARKRCRSSGGDVLARPWLLRALLLVACGGSVNFGGNWCITTPPPIASVAAAMPVEGDSATNDGSDLSSSGKSATSGTGAGNGDDAFGGDPGDVDGATAGLTSDPETNVLVNGTDNITAATTTERPPKAPTTAKEQMMAMRRSWQKALDEIRSLVVAPKAATRGGKGEAVTDATASGRRGATSPLLQRWKLLTAPGALERILGGTNETSAPTAQRGIDRYEGFASWERKLQEWGDEVSDYIEKNWPASGGDGVDRYPMATFGTVLTPPPLEASTYEANVTASPPEAEAAPAIDESAPASPSDAKPVGANQIVKTGADKFTAKDKKVESGKSKTPVKELFAFPDVTFLPGFVPRPAKPDEPIVPHTDVSDKSKNIWVVTTAALPWMTGTAVNPLLRAAYLTRGRREAGGSSTIMLPWLERTEDQIAVFGGGSSGERRFETQADQEDYIRTWLRDTAGMGEAADELRIRWYTAWQEKMENSLYSMGDITALIPEEEVDICVLEEPEHMNWYRAPGESWTNKFKHVVGVVHTNYFVYAQEQPGAFIRAPSMQLLCSWMCRAHCHRLIKLSGTLGIFAPEKELVENVHGVRKTFLDVGSAVGERLENAQLTKEDDPVFGREAFPSVYFIGKMLWSKGLGSLMELMKYAEESAGLRIKVDMYGGGPNKDEAMKKSSTLGLDMPFHGPVDHAELANTHKIFINPSTSEVLCTTAAEALAMGKFVILPSHPSNDFFCQFPNCLPYASKEEFVGNLYYALTHSPEPLSEDYSYALSWEAATERFEAAAAISVAEAEAMAEALSTPEGSVEIDLPPLIESEERRTKIMNTLRLSRERYRRFRSRLSQEIQQQQLLPYELQQRVVSELDKRLDVDLEEMLGSPKLRLKLSPAELDKQLLELYNTVTQGPGGDVLRVIGGGWNVGQQNLYLKRQANKLKNKGQRTSRSAFVEGPSPLLSPTMTLSLLTADGKESQDVAITQRIKKALQRNLVDKNRKTLQFNGGSSNENTESSLSGAADTRSNRDNAPKMSLSGRSSRPAGRFHDVESAIRWRPSPNCFLVIRPSMSTSLFAKIRI